MAYGNIPRFEPNYGNRYGFRQLPAPSVAPIGAPIPGTPATAGTVPPSNAPPAPAPYHSGVSAEGIDGNTGPGSNIDGGDPSGGGAAAHYASPEEAFAYNKSGFDNGYYGTVQDAAAASLKGNANATSTLQGFIASGPTGRQKAPGTLGFLGTQLNEALNGGPQYDYRNIDDSINSLSQSGDLYNNDNSSGYYGDSLSAQQTVSDVDATKTFGHRPGAEPTLQQLQGPEIFHDALDNQATQQAEQQANYDHYQDNSSDDNHGQTDGTQTGGETSHAGGYGGYADDSASSGGGGGGGGK